MVKGTTRQVVFVKAPEDGLFEQAIYLLRPDAVSGGFRQQEVLRQAELAASGELEQSVGRPHRRLSAAVWFSLGAVCAALPLLLLLLL